MIADQHTFKLARIALRSGNIKELREYLEKYDPAKLALSDAELLRLAAESPVWD